MLLRHQSDLCVTLICPSARTIPEVQQVPIRLKVMLREAEQRLKNEYSKEIADGMIERLKQAIENVDERKLLEGFALFVDRQISEKVDLPFPVEERVVIDRTFATREMVRAHLSSLNYHVLLLSLEKAELMEAYTDQVLRDRIAGFPMTNEYSGNALANTMAGVQIEQPRKFWHEVDEAVRGVVGPHGHVVVVSVAEHYTPFLESAAKPGIYIGNLPGNRSHETPQQIMKEAWEVAYADQKKRQLAEVQKLAKAPVGLTAIDVGDIWRRVLDGRGHLLFVERDRKQPAIVENGTVRLIEKPETNHAVDDLVDDIIEQQLKHGGQVHVLPNGALEEYGGIALLMRY